MNKTALNSQKEKHFMLSLRRATPALLPITVSISQFLSTISLRRATVPWPTVSPPTPNFYPRSPCGERLDLSGLDTVCRAISIHALLAESDARNSPHRPRKSHFYPRSPCGERRPDFNLADYLAGFLSTLSLRRATVGPRPCGPARIISIHALLAESDVRARAAEGQRPISIHALLAESDARKHRTRGAVYKISIHALLAESDYLSNNSRTILRPISIHALLAESDPSWATRARAARLFLSTLSLRRATQRRHCGRAVL